jgi:cytoskeletal protein CcmA (bactofilin family)
MKQSNKNTEVKAFLEEGCELQGTLNFTGIVRINGRFTGEIHSKEALIIGSSAEINGILQVGSAIIGGRVEGTIHASERLEIQSSAQVRATVQAPVLIIHEGAQISGDVQVIRNMKAPAETTRPAGQQLAPQPG